MREVYRYPRGFEYLDFLSEQSKFDCRYTAGARLTVLQMVGCLN
jgi:hypothetical protein